MRSPVDVIMGRVGGLAIREIARRTVPCYKNVLEGDREELQVCLLIDSRYLYAYPFKETKGTTALGRKAAYLRGEMEHLRLREFQPGICRYINRTEQAAS